MFAIIIGLLIMIAWIKEHPLNRFVAMLITSIFLFTTFACFLMAVVNVYTGEMGTVCDKVLSLVDNTLIQTEVTLMVILAVGWLSTRPGVFFTQSELNLSLAWLYSPPLSRPVLSREHSYLSSLFSSGIINSKIYHSAT